ncbi:MAG: HAMP domain-containing histidine kinase [Kiritimatiellae bacterium]|nr:HAMP domain-containing histidine kinase [Kiritimatiellia bacterium]
MFRNSRAWIAPTVAMAAFLTAILAFVIVICRYFESVKEWSQGDLDSRARLTALALSEPLKTLDFKAVEGAANRLANDGLRLRIVMGEKFTPPSGSRVSGGFFDSLNASDFGVEAYQWSAVSSGGFSIAVGRPSSETLRPFFSALVIAALAALTGMCAMGFVFFALYRQRVRIQQLKRLEKFRSDFIADVSHEIRTPLTGILGIVDILGDQLDSAKMPLLNLLKSSAGRLSQLVQQILDLSKMEQAADKLALHMREYDVSAIARDVAQTYGVKFHANESSGESGILLCDSQMITQALSNLVENAKRHSQTDEIFVECRATRSSIILAVEDHGVGIPSGHEERIFERFHRVDPSRAAETGGAGLGLAIVRSAAHLHGGNAIYKGVKPTGSRFEIILPRRGA